MLIDIILIMAFAFFIWASGVLIDSIQELRDIKRAKLVRSIRNHPAGKAR